MVILERIEEAIAAGRVTPAPLPTAKSVRKISDLLTSYEDFYSEGAALCTSSWTGQRNPKFKISPRRTPRPILPPKKVEPPPSFYPPALFFAFQAVQEWYERENIDTGTLASLSVSVRNFDKYTNKFYQTMPYPLCLHWENVDSLQDLDCLYLCLPSVSYHDECSGMFEAFLHGAESVAGMLMHMDSDASFELSKPTRKIVTAVGYVELCKHYYAYNGSKLFDVNKVQSFYESFFEPLAKKYPEDYYEDIPVISGDEGQHEIPIKSIESIDFALDFCKADEEMHSCIPNVWRMEEREDSESEEFVKELCRVWRKK